MRKRKGAVWPLLDLVNCEDFQKKKTKKQARAGTGICFDVLLYIQPAEPDSGQFID